MSSIQAFKADILIVDDTPANLRLLSQMLLDQGYEVRAVTSGARALESVSVSVPDLILLDIKRMDRLTPPPRILRRKQLPALRLA